jgi:ribosome-binding factor A
MSGGGRRADRVAERIKVELSELLLRGTVRDPDAADACVTDVKVSDDLSHARVYVRLLRNDVSEKAQAGAIEALNRAAGFLRRELSPKLKLKYQPELRFFWDEGIDRATRIEELLSEIEREGREGTGR